MNKVENNLSRSKKHKKKKRKFGLGRILLILLAIIGLILGYAFIKLKMTTDTMHTDISEDKIVHSSRENTDMDLSGDKPFSILLLGIDTGDMGRIEQGRSDTLMVMTVNPESKQTTLLSMPRDTYTEIIDKGINDKINHAYAFGGAAMSMNTVQNLLDIPIDYYVSVNMEGIQQIVNAVDGITVTPNISFSQDGYDFIEGQPTTMDGAQALAYSRMRNQDPEGDYGRQSRQREIVESTLSEVTSLNTVLNYQPVLKSMEDNVNTNLKFNEMVNISLNYNKALRNIEEIQMNGSGTKIEGIYYEIIPDEEVEEISQTLKKELGISE